MNDDSRTPQELQEEILHLKARLHALECPDKVAPATQPPSPLGAGVGPYLHLLLENTEDVILILDPQGRILYFNGSRSYEAASTDVIGKTADDLFPPEQAAMLQRQIHAVLDTGERSTIEVQLTWKGQPLWFSDHAFPMRDHSGRIVGVGKVCRNITEAKRAQHTLEAAQADLETRVAERTAQLQAANARLTNEIAERARIDVVFEQQRELALALSTTNDLRAAIDRILDAACRLEGVDVAGLYLVNAQNDGLDLAAHRNVSPEFLAGQSHIPASAPHLEFIRAGRPAYREAADMAFVDDTLNREGIRALGIIPLWHDDRVVGCLNVGSRTQDVLSQRTRSAAETLAVWISPVLDRVQSHQKLEDAVRARTGELTILNTALAAEVADRQAAETALRTSEQRYRHLVDAMKEGLCAVDEQYVFTYVNEAYCQIAGRQADELLGRSAYDCYRPEDVPFLKAQQAQRRKGSTPPFEFRYYHADGSFRDALVSPSPLFDDSGRFAGSISVITDITELKHAAELEATNSAMQAQIEEQRQAEELLRLQRDLAIAMGSATDLTLALAAVLDAACQVEHIDCGGVYLADYDRRELRLVTQHNVPREFAEATATLPLDGDVARILLAGKPVSSNDGDLDMLRPELDRVGVQSAIVIPVLHDGRLVASLNVASLHSPLISQNARYTLEALAAQIGPLLERVRLHETLERRVKERTRELTESNTALRAEISRRQQAEELLLHRQREYQTLAENAPDVVARYDRDLRIVYANQAYARNVGREPADVVGKTNRDLWFPAAEAETRDARLRKVLDTGVPDDLDITVAGANGLRHYDVRIVPEKDAHGEIRTLLLVARDITARVHAETQLQASERRYRTLAETMSEGVFLTDPDDRFVFVNERFCSMLGRSSETLLGKLLVECARPDEKDLVQAKLAERRRGIARTYEFTFRHDDGSTVDVLVSPKPLLDDDGQYAGNLVVCTDITDRKRAESELFASREAERSLRLRLAELLTLNNILSRAGSFDELCRQAVNLGRQALSIDRIGLWWITDDDQRLAGSFGTDETGKPRDERHVRVPIAPDVRHTLGLPAGTVVRLAEQPLYDHRRSVVGHGMCLQTAIWDGQRVTGILYADNLLAHSAFTQTDEELLALYASVLGHLASRARTDEQLQKSEARSRAITNAIPDMVYRFNKDGIVLDYKPATSDDPPSHAEQFHGRNIRETLPLAVSSLFAAQISGTLAAGEPHTFEYALTLGNDLRHFEGRMAPYEREEVVLIVRDITEQKRMTTALAESEQRFRSIVKASPMGIHLYQLDSDDRLIFIDSNPAASRITGMDMTGLHGLTIEEAFPNLKDTPLLASYMRAVHHNAPYSTTDFYYSDDQINGVYDVYAFQASPGRLCVLFLDVTERQRAALALQDSEERYRTLAETATDHIFILDENGKHVFANSAAAAAFRMRPAEIIGKTLRDMFPKKKVDAILRALRRTIATGEVANFTDLIPYPTGDAWVAVRFTPLPTPRGAVPCIMGVARDVTELKEASEALRQSEVRYRTLAETAQDLIFIVDRDDRIQYVNTQGAAFFQTTPEQMVGRSRGDLFPPDIAARQMQNLRRVFNTGDPVAATTHTVFPAGEAWLDTRLTPMRDHTGGIRAVLGIARDVTGLKRTEQALLQNQENERQFRKRLTVLLEVVNDLSKDEDLATLCKHAVRFGRSRLGFDRLGLAFLDETAPDRLRGMYGTDEGGRIRDERRRRFAMAPETLDAIRQHKPAALLRFDEHSLFNDLGKVVGNGCLLQSPMWDGEKVLGILSGDNLLRQEPISDYDCELFRLYASTLGHLCSRVSEQSAHLTHVRKLTQDAEKNIENERSHLARELHDELGQILTAINMELAWFEKRADALGPDGPGRVAQMQGIVKSAVNSIRHLSKSLRPPIIEHQGLTDAIRSHVSDFEKRTGVVCRVKIDPPDLEAIDPSATVVYRIVQESLTNVARHSRAGRCDVSVRLMGDVLEVKVRDDGVGAASGAFDGKSTLGVLGMKERTSSLGGRLSITNEPGGGVCVTATLPWPK